MILTKEDLKKVATSRSFSPYYKGFIVCAALILVWTGVFAFIASSMIAPMKWIFVILEAFPCLVLLLWAINYQIKENKYVKDFLAKNGYLIGKEI
jgi:hypothetical protein